ncbi:phage tail assembly chaperone G [Bacillus capparidis]|uniref:Phage protein n=1 Tax=Bacillus capparidis TaxID=1840411 RepID=A0ABS4D1K1_9BACI|nr:hypothetical protein [Bacillus capparidis]MBP1083506.1 hypothetical protein [Bacillus capparidis]MED1094705.1 hypothetical protein [Bacillus capparidis]
MKKLTLLINGEEKNFTIPFVNGLVWRKFIELRGKTENLSDLKPEELDEFAGLVVFAFGDKFSLEEFYAGVPYDQVMSTIDGLFVPTEGDAEGNGKK